MVEQPSNKQVEQFTLGGWSGLAPRRRKAAPAGRPHGAAFYYRGGTDRSLYIRVRMQGEERSLCRTCSHSIAGGRDGGLRSAEVLIARI